DPKLILTNLLNNINLIEKSVPIYRLNNTYSDKIKKDFVPKMLKVIDYYKYNQPIYEYINDPDFGLRRVNLTGWEPNRYLSINIESLRKYKTIEIRCHEGTTSCAEIYKWVKFLYGVAYGKYNNKTKNYIKQRIKTKGKYQAKRIV